MDKFCVNCVHYLPPNKNKIIAPWYEFEPHCKREGSISKSYIDGTVKYKQESTIWWQRENKNLCGPEAKYYQKISWIKKLIRAL